MKNFIEVTKNDEKCLINVNNILCVTPMTKSDENTIKEMTDSEEMQALFDIFGDALKEKVDNIREEMQNTNTLIQLVGFNKESNKVLYVDETYSEIKNMIKEALT